MLKRAVNEALARQKELFVVAFLLVNSLSGYFIDRRHMDIVLRGLNTTAAQNLAILGVHDLLIIGSSLTGAWLSTKIKRSIVLYLWMILGTVSSILICFLPHLLLIQHVQMISFFWGISFGLGMPSCLAYFGELTKFENRGYIAGLIFFVASAAAPLLLMVLTISFEMSVLTSVVWRAIGLIALVLLKEKSIEEKYKRTSFRLILRDRQFLLYIIPWFMFSCIYGFQKVTLEHTVDVNVYEILRVIQSSFGAVSAFLSGTLCGRFGRKKVIIYGFVSLGVAYALVSIASASIISLYFYSIIDGIAWGIFIVMFVLVLWGDISMNDKAYGEKYYAIGGAPFFFADFVGFLSAPYLWFPINAAFSVASFFLFLAVVPLMFAPETLPEKKLRERELRSYIEKAKKVKEKFT
jgi:MFS family permease